LRLFRVQSSLFIASYEAEYVGSAHPTRLLICIS
jgi:hypothetical protein